MLDELHEAVVIAQQQASGECRLVAYFIPRSAVTVSAIREKLAQHLPDYMIPAVFVQVPRFPVSATGKIARKQLPAPENMRPQLASAYQVPRTEIERKIIDIWQSVLRIEPVGIHDSFLDLGGDSLSAMQVLSRIQETFQRDIAVGDFFERATVYEQAGLFSC